MDSPTFVKRVAELSGVDKESAERVVRARLEKEAAGSAAFERGRGAALAYVLRRERLRRTVRIAIVSNPGLLSGRTFARPEGLASVR